MADVEQKASGRSYWLDLFTGATWQEFLAAGGDVSGFRESRWKTMQRLKPGDYLLCYLTGISRFIGLLQVASAPFRDKSPIWKDEDFPCRVRVKPVVTLTPETAVPILQLRGRLSFLAPEDTGTSWTGHVRGSPTRWSDADGQVVVETVLAAKENPVVRPVNPAKLGHRPRALKAKIGPVTVPEDEEEDAVEEVAEPGPGPTVHTEMQYLLLKLGSDMGLDIWVARNDRKKTVNGQAIATLPRLKDELPLQFDEATNRTIELIDVLWLRGNSIVAAFEVESTTAVYSGLLRMADLITMQPNINIPLYIVAPDERQNKVIQEVNRPTFTALSHPMSELCRFIAFSTLRDRVKQVEPVVRYLKPDFLEELAESCEVEEE
jgi:hypothetical protein